MDERITKRLQNLNLIEESITNNNAIYYELLPFSSGCFTFGFSSIEKFPASPFLLSLSAVYLSGRDSAVSIVVFILLRDLLYIISGIGVSSEGGEE
jgi:hypothetical protein